MKGYIIYRDNTVIYEFVVDYTISKSLSGNKYVSFTISSNSDLDLKIGDYVLVGNETVSYTHLTLPTTVPV